MSSKPITVIFGSGANVGAAITKKFLGAGYRVATVRRSAPEPAAASQDGNSLDIQADLSQPAQIPQVFETIRKTWNATPRVVIWNVAGLTPPTDDDNIFSIPNAALESDLGLMVTSPFAAAGEAVKGWHASGDAGRFIMTGNFLPRNVLPVAKFTTLGVGKSGGAYWVGTADALYKAKDWRFFFADERMPDGGPMMSGPDGQSHADMYLALAEGKNDVPYFATFVNGKYQAF